MPGLKYPAAEGAPALSYEPLTPTTHQIIDVNSNKQREPANSNKRLESPYSN
jgi:hypothetical protein